MTDERWKLFEAIAVQRMNIGHGSSEDVAIIAAYLELKQRREDEEWLFKAYREGKISRVCIRYSNRDDRSYFRIIMTDSDMCGGEGPTLHAAIDAAREGEG